MEGFRQQATSLSNLPALACIELQLRLIKLYVTFMPY